MTEADAPVRSSGPQWLQQPTTDVLYPAAVSRASLDDLLASGDDADPSVLPPQFLPKFARWGRSPVVYGAVALVGLAAAVWAHGWAQWDSSASSRAVGSEWWSNLTAVLLPVESHGDPVSTFRMWVALAVMVAAAVAVAMWIGRIGRNVRQEHRPFGVLLALAAFPAWWILPLTLGGDLGTERTRYDRLIRVTLAFGLLFAQYLLLRWPTLNRIWRAGRIRYDICSIVLWLPEVVPLMMILGASSYTIFQATGGKTEADSGWRVTETLNDTAMWFSRVTGVGILVLLVVVSVLQHVGMKQDKRDEAAHRAEHVRSAA